MLLAADSLESRLTAFSAAEIKQQQKQTTNLKILTKDAF
jgi:hypothetical protein